MKKIIRYAGIGLGVLLVGVAGVLTFVKVGLPGASVGAAEDVKIQATAAKIERGKYLANHVSVCMDCHSTRDWSLYSAPLIPGSQGKGGERFGPEVGVPGEVYSRNITPAGLTNWTDGEILRAITSGVNKDGRALFPIMPHPRYGHMDRNDVESIVAYVRSLQPIQNPVPDPHLDFPLNFIVNTIPQKPAFEAMPDTTDEVALGRYLTNAAACGDCHTKAEQGKPVPGMDFAGGNPMASPMGPLQTANITPDPETGIGRWTKEAFIARFKSYDLSKGYQPHKVNKGEMQTIMPWTMYAGMSERDLGAIYAYLRTVKPIKNKVVVFNGAAPAVAAN